MFSGIKKRPSLGLALLPSVLSPQTVVELFYQTVARKTIISQIYTQQQSTSPSSALLHWPHMVSNVVHLLAQLLYPSFTVRRLLVQHLPFCYYTGEVLYAFYYLIAGFTIHARLRINSVYYFVIFLAWLLPDQENSPLVWGSCCHCLQHERR